MDNKNEQDVYLMSQGQFNNLSTVRGFNDLNGNSYQEHICIILDEYLNNDQCTKIKNFQHIENALNFLATIVSYTHDYKKSQNYNNQ